MAYAPSTGTTATTLREVSPDIADDIAFVLEKSLHRFEQKLVEKVEGFKNSVLFDFAENIDECDAIEKYGGQASEKSQLFFASLVRQTTAYLDAVWEAFFSNPMRLAQMWHLSPQIQ